MDLNRKMTAFGTTCWTKIAHVCLHHAVFTDLRPA
jgi:hypothetical protein